MKNVAFWDIRHVALVRTEVSEKLIASIIRVTMNGDLRETFAVTSNRRTLRTVFPTSPIPVTLMMGALGSSETLVVTRATWHHITEDGIALYQKS
jgi:hypothetical protein